VRDPFELPRADKVVTPAINRTWPMTIRLPDLGAAFSLQRVGNGQAAGATEGRVMVQPGVYILSSAGAVDLSTLPRFLGPIGLTEFHAPPADTVAPAVDVLSASEFVAGQEARVSARVVQGEAPDSVKLFIRRTAGDWYHAYWMRSTGGYRYETVVPADSLRPGPYEYVIVRYQDNLALTFPGGHPQQPWDWNYNGRASWKVNVIGQGTPVILFDPGTDANLLAFTRIGDAGRRGLFSVGISPVTGRPVFHLRLPPGDGGAALQDYTASLVVRDRITARGQSMAAATSVALRLRGLGARQTLYLTLMEDDGTSWTAPVTVDSTWSETMVSLGDFKVGRGVLLPQGFPGQWNYWVGAAVGRGGSGDRPRMEHLERLQLSLRPEGGPTPAHYGVEVEWVLLRGQVTSDR
jgi:hypothetical protein